MQEYVDHSETDWSVDADHMFTSNFYTTYITSISVALLTILVALYYSYHLKNKSEKQLQEVFEQNNKSLSDRAEHNTFTSLLGTAAIKSNFLVKETVDSDESDDMNNFRTKGFVHTFKSSKFRELEATLSKDQLAEERRVERVQMAAIFELLKKQENELNVKDIDENELNAQLNLYR